MQQYVFLPDKRSNAEEVVATLEHVVLIDPNLHFLATPAALGAGAQLTANVAVRGASRRGLEILDVVQQSGATLVRTSNTGPVPIDPAGGTFHPVVNYTFAVANARFGRMRVTANAGPAGTDFLKMVVRSSATGKAVEGALATLRLKGSNQQIGGVSDHFGIVSFGLRAPAVVDAMLVIEPGFAGHWGYYDAKASFQSGHAFEIDPIDLSRTPDSLRHLITPGQIGVGTGVIVGVIDTGVGPHPHLEHVKGDPDSSIGHGTHVAGIIAGSGPGPMGGIAPGVTIRSYRVFADPATGIARNFEIHRAIEQAVEHGCHIINLSLKVERELDPRHDDKVLSRAIEDAADRGVLIVAAAGNDFRRFVAFPARHPDVIAVSALGWEPGLPPKAYDRWTVSSDRGDPDAIFFATFSNEGAKDTSVDLVGPGAGVVSTVPGGGYAPMSGTSMACPAMSGAIAKLLAMKQNLHILGRPADRDRFLAMQQLVFGACKSQGLKTHQEGRGMLV